MAEFRPRVAAAFCPADSALADVPAADFFAADFLVAPFFDVGFLRAVFLTVAAGPFAPPSCLFTVAHARLAAVFFETPFFS